MGINAVTGHIGGVGVFLDGISVRRIIIGGQEGRFEGNVVYFDKYFRMKA